MKIKGLNFFKDNSNSYDGSAADPVGDLFKFVKEWKKTYLYIQCSWQKMHVPMLDVDKVEDFHKACDKLRRHGVSFMAMKSSDSKYWVLIDSMEASIPDALELIDGLPCDSNYLKLVQARKMFSMRANLKNGFFPEIIKPEKKQKFTVPFMEFAESLNSYYHGSYGRIYRLMAEYEEELELARTGAGIEVESLFHKPKSQKEKLWDTL